MIKNTGQTPANDVAMKIDLAVRTWPIDQTDIAAMELADVAISLGSGSTFTVTAMSDMPLTEEEFTEIESGTSVLLAYGIVRYQDIFMDARHTEIGAWYAKNSDVPDHGKDMHPLKKWNKSN